MSNELDRIENSSPSCEPGYTEDLGASDTEPAPPPDQDDVDTLVDCPIPTLPPLPETPMGMGAL